jgi:hypothetical protein
VSPAPLPINRAAVIPARDVHRFVVLAVDRRTGRTIWERTATEAKPHEASHQENGTYASSSAITDGRASTPGSSHRACMSTTWTAQLLWSKDLGDKTMRNQFGEGSTPVLAGDRLVIVWDHLAGSFIVALDATNGRELWRQSRDEIDTWATPLVVEQDGRKQAVVPGKNKIRSYDLETGAIVWESKGTTMNPIPSPVFGDGMVFVTSGFQGNNLKAIRLADARAISPAPSRSSGRSIATHPYVPSPLLYDNVLYLLKTNSGILSRSTRRRQAALPAPAARWIARGVLVTGRRERPRLHRGPRRRHPCDPPRVDVRAAGEEQAGRRIRCLTGAGGQRYLLARVPEPVLHRRAYS